MPLLTSHRHRKPWLSASLRVLLALFFVVSGALKIVDLGRFHTSVLHFDVVYGPAAEWIAIVVPCAEIVLGVLLVFNLMSAAALTLLGGMVVSFTVAIGMAWSKGLNISCGCFGKLSDQPMDYPLRISANVGLLILISALLAVHLRRPAYQHRPGYTLPKHLFAEK